MSEKFRPTWGNTTIHEDALVNFVRFYAYENIGKDEDGNPTTLSDEMAEVAKMISRTDVCRLAVDPYRHSRLAFAIAEMDEEQKEAQIRNNYRRAGSKIFWLNSMCRCMTGRPFIAHKLNPKSESDVGALVDSFEYVIRYAAANAVSAK